MDQIINLRDFRGEERNPTRERRLELARREYPGMTVMYVGKGTPLGNKDEEFFAKGKEDMQARLKSIAKYRVWIWGKIKANDPEVMAALNAITEDTILACWCHPLPCHSKVIWAAWHYVKSKERANQLQTA